MIYLIILDKYIINIREPDELKNPKYFVLNSL